MTKKRFGSIEKYYTKQGKRYLVRYRVNGKQHKKMGFLKLSEASAYLSRLQIQIETNQYIEYHKITLGKWLDLWLDLYCRDLKESTKHGYMIYINRVKKHPISAMYLQKIDPCDLQKLYNDFREEYIYREHDAIKTLKPLAEKSLEQLHRIIHASLKKAVIDNKIYRNPADLVRCPKSKNHNHIILSPDEAIEILQKLSDTDVYIPVLLAIIMGLRRGEMLGLRWSDIDFSTNTLSVNRNRLGIGAKETVTSPKTPKSKRILYMPQMAISALKKFKISSKPNIAENPDKYVCVDSYGIPFKANYFTNQYKKALANHGIQPMRYHDLRHYCVALLIAAGAVPKEISDYLGHSEIGITMDLYGDLFDEYKKNSKGYGFHNIFSSI